MVDLFINKDSNSFSSPTSENKSESDKNKAIIGSTMGLIEVKGTKEYLPEEQLVRERVQDVLKTNFKKYGFKPIETSVLDFYEVGANKYAGGGEIMKEVYSLQDQGKRELILRYELTFKLAKLVGMNPNLRLPFKRYEIGKVFRDGPVKTGRLREFTQCDVDIVGVKEVYADAEIVLLALKSFKDLNLDIQIEVSNKKFLFGLMRYCKIPEDKLEDSALSLDKFKKFGEDYVTKELIEKGVKDDSISLLFDNLQKAQKLTSNEEKISFFEKIIKDEEGKNGLSELQELFLYLKDKKDVVFLPTLSRGLGYYTGMFFEVYSKNPELTSSVAAGGRWDKMIQNFLGSNQEFPSTGIAFGLDVICSALKLEGKDSLGDSSISFAVIPIKTLKESFELSEKIRESGFGSVLIDKKLSKALDYADKEMIPYIIVLGEKEIKENKFKVRNMKTGKEKDVSLDSLENLKDMA